MISRLHYLTQSLPDRSHARLAAEACRGGVDWVQLRLKGASAADWAAQARETLAVCRQHGARLIINDNVALARDMDADGVHLGKTDMPPARARQLLGPGKIIGGTANTWDDIRALAQAGVDYIGLGPFRFTPTKENLSPVLGLAGYRLILDQCRLAGLQLPLIAIGGITADDVPALMGEGLHGVAVSAAINKSANPAASASTLIQQIAGAASPQPCKTL